MTTSANPTNAQLDADAHRKARKKEVYGDSQEYCPSCGKLFAQWSDGRLFRHGPNRKPCPGSGRVPEELSKELRQLWRKS